MNLRAAIAEQADSGVVSKESLGKARLTPTEYIANHKLLPHLLKFCEEYRAIKIGQAAEAARMEAEMKMKEPWRNRGKRYDKAARTDSGTSGNKWVSANVDPSAMNKTMPTRMGSSDGFGSGEIQMLDQPRVLCRCGHGELWHRRPSRPVRQRMLSEEKPKGPPPGLAAGSRSLMNRDDFSTSGTATVSGGRLLLCQAGASALHHSVSTPDFSKPLVAFLPAVS